MRYNYNCHSSRSSYEDERKLDVISETCHEILFKEITDHVGKMSTIELFELSKKLKQK